MYSRPPMHRPEFMSVSCFLQSSLEAVLFGEVVEAPSGFPPTSKSASHLKFKSDFGKTQTQWKDEKSTMQIGSSSSGI